MALVENRDILDYLEMFGLVCGVLFVRKRQMLENRIRAERHLYIDLLYNVNVGCWLCYPEMWGHRVVIDE